MEHLPNPNIFKRWVMIGTDCNIMNLDTILEKAGLRLSELHRIAETYAC